MRRFVLFRFVYASAVFVSFTAAAEDIQIDYPRNLSEQVVNPTADATAMLRYQDCPVSYATGTADVNIPLLQYKYGELTLSLSISYHTGGIKVDDPAGCIGLGWSLQGLGRVSRQICVMPDEKLGFMGAEEMNNPTARDFYDLMFYKKIDNPQSKDANYDRYNYDIPGYSGTFIIDGDSIVNFSQNGVKIVCGISNNIPRTILMITPDGTRYTFGSNDNIEKCSYKERVTDGVFKDYDRNYDNVPVAWMLTEVTNANMWGNIQISYAKSSATQKEKWVQTPTVTRRWDLQSSSIASTFKTEGQGSTGTTTYSNRAIPSRICCFSDTIYFDLKTSAGSSEDDKRLIGAIRVVNSQGKEIRKITFDNNSLFEDKRPRLDAVTITSEGQIIDRRKFDYNAGIKNSYSDFFGYANGRDRNYSVYAQTYIIDPEKLTLNPDRSFSYQYVSAWSLKKITDATGVETTFEYEPSKWFSNITGNNPQTICSGLRIRKIKSYDPITRRERLREFQYSDPEMSIPLNMLTLRNFISLSGVKSYNGIKNEQNEVYSLSATFTSSSNNAGVPAEKMRIYYGKVTETVSGTDMSPIKTDYVFDNTHCISTQLSYFPVYGSKNAQQRSSDLIVPGDRNRIKLGYNLQAGIREYYPSSDFYDVFGYRENIVNFKEIACPQPLLVKKICYEYDNGSYRPVETTEKFYSSHDRFRFPAGVFVQGNVYKTFYQGEYGYNIYDGDCPADPLSSTLHERCWVYSERIRHDSTAVTRHYPDGNTRTVWQRHYYNNLLSKIENILYENPDTILPAPSDTLTFTSTSLLPVTTITGCGNDYLIHNTIRVRNIKIGPKVTGNYYEAIMDRLLGYTPVTDRWIVKSGIMTDSVSLKRVFAGFAYNSTIKPKYVTLGREASQNIAWQKFHGYNTCGNVTSMTENDGLLKNFTWDATGFLLTSKKIADLTTYYTWQPHVGCTSITEPSGRKHTFSYSGGRLTAERNTAGDTVATYGYSLYADGGRNMTEKTVFGDKGGATTRVFYDGFGLPVQTVAVNGSGDGSQHVSTYMTYDALDRPRREYRPVPIDEADAMTGLDDFASLASSFYGGDSRPFTATAYLASAGEKVAAVYSPGAAFADYPSRMSYLCNNTTDPELTVRRYVYIPTNNSIVLAKVYPKGALDAVKSVDPDGHTLLTFTDWRGYKILERRKLSDSDFLDTYYINDVWGNPLVVLQPMASNVLTQNIKSWKIDSDNTLLNYAFVYRYDRCGRLIYSRVPGCRPVEYKYDEYGRVAFMRDGNLSSQSLARFYLYEPGGRPAVTGLCDDTPFDIAGNHPAMTVTLDVSTDGICNTGYILANSSLPIFNPVLLSANYYDSYDYKEMDGFSSLPKAPTNHASALGLPTGEMLALFGIQGNKRIYKSIYYNTESLPTNQYSTTHITGATERTQTFYTLDGREKVLARYIEGIPVSARCAEGKIFDQHGRVTGISSTMTDATSLSKKVQYVYNSIGQLEKTVLGGRVSTTYKYNISGALKTVNNRFFTQHLFYEDGTDPCYNGCISQINDHTGVRSFTYDKAGRLKTATHKYESDTRFSTSYSYDLNSNITSLSRYGYTASDQTESVLVDDLTMTYSGNKLTKVYDDVGEILWAKSYDFDDGADADNEYSYDANGNLTKDLNRGINKIKYSVLNLPSEIFFSDSTKLSFIYDASGRKLSEFYTGKNTSIRYDFINGFEIRDSTKLDKIYIVGGYFSKGRGYYYSRDYQGNILFVSQDYSKLQSNTYYPYGVHTSETVGVESDYRYGGKWFMPYKGLNSYDFGARTYAPDICRFWQPDPKAHDYHWLSPYAYCGGDPINFIDPTGEKIYYVDMAGRLITSEEVLNKISNRPEYEAGLEGLDRVVIIDQDGKIISESDTFEEGTIESTIENIAFDKGGSTTDFTSFVVRGDAAAVDLFEFLANTITGSGGYEYSLQQTGISGDKGLNFISTSHLKGREVGAGWLFRQQLQFGYTINSWIHSHPTSPMADNADKSVRNLVKDSWNGRYKHTLFKIYHVPTKQYIDFSE